MKKLIVIVIVVLVAAFGYWFTRGRENRAPDSSTVITNGGNTWYVGKVVINGTNVPAGQMKLQAIRATNALPQHKENPPLAP